MLSKIFTKPISAIIYILLATAKTTRMVRAADPDDIFVLGEPTFYGTGCPEGTVSVTTSTDGDSVSVLFSAYYAETSYEKKRDRKGCSLAVPVDVKQGWSIGIFKVDYRGYAFVPDDDRSKARFSAEYFFAGNRGPRVSKTFKEDEPNFYEEDFLGVQAMSWSQCGASTIFRINTSISAQKDDIEDDDVEIGVDSVDTTVYEAWRYHFQKDSARCGEN
eukprot:499495_1